MIEKIKNCWRRLLTTRRLNDAEMIEAENRLHLVQIIRSSIRIFGGVCTGLGALCAVAAVQVSELQISLEEGVLEVKAGDKEAQDASFLLALFGASLLVGGDISRKCFTEEDMQDWDLGPMSDRLSLVAETAGETIGLDGWHGNHDEENFPPMPPPSSDGVRDLSDLHTARTSTSISLEKTPDHQNEFSISVVWGTKKGLIVSAAYKPKNGKSHRLEELAHSHWEIGFLDGWLERWGATAQTTNQDPQALIKTALLRLFKVQRFRDLENKTFWCSDNLDNGNPPEAWRALDSLCDCAVQLYSDKPILEAARLLGRPPQELLKLKRSWEKESIWRNIATQQSKVSKVSSCFGCKDFCGYGGESLMTDPDPLICAIHPRGWQRDGACPDRRQIPTPTTTAKKATFLFFEDLTTAGFAEMRDRTGTNCLVYFLTGTTLLGKEWQGYLFSPYSLGVMNAEVPKDVSAYLAGQFLPKGCYISQIRFMY